MSQDSKKTKVNSQPAYDIKTRASSLQGTPSNSPTKLTQKKTSKPDSVGNI